MFGNICQLGNRYYILGCIYVYFSWWPGSFIGSRPPYIYTEYTWEIVFSENIVPKDVDVDSLDLVVSSHFHLGTPYFGRNAFPTLLCLW